jgi:phage head maturation protease
LGGVIGSTSYKKEYSDGIVSNWAKQLNLLCEITESEPQAAYSAYTKGFRSKFTYFLQTIDNFEEYTEPIDTLIDNTFIPTLFGHDTPLETHYRDIFSQAPSEGGLGIPILKEEANIQFQSSSLVSKIHVVSILEQSNTMKPASSAGESQKMLKEINLKKKRDQKKQKHREIYLKMYLKI